MRACTGVGSYRARSRCDGMHAAQRNDGRSNYYSKEGIYQTVLASVMNFLERAGDQLGFYLYIVIVIRPATTIGSRRMTFPVRMQYYGCSGPYIMHVKMSNCT